MSNSTREFQEYERPAEAKVPDISRPSIFFSIFSPKYQVNSENFPDFIHGVLQNALKPIVAHESAKKPLFRPVWIRTRIPFINLAPFRGPNGDFSVWFGSFETYQIAW